MVEFGGSEKWGFVWFRGMCWVKSIGFSRDDQYLFCGGMKGWSRSGVSGVGVGNGAGAVECQGWVYGRWGF